MVTDRKKTCLNKSVQYESKDLLNKMFQRNRFFNDFNKFCHRSISSNFHILELSYNFVHLYSRIHSYKCSIDKELFVLGTCSHFAPFLCSSTHCYHSGS